MKRHIHAILVMAIATGTFALIAPTRAEAQEQECVRKHFAYASQQPSNPRIRHIVTAQLVMVRDEQSPNLDLSAQAGGVELIYRPGFMSNGVSYPETLSADAAVEINKDRFVGAVRVVLKWDGHSAGLSWRNTFWNLPADEMAQGICVNDNTVVFSMRGFGTYVLKLYSQEVPNFVRP